MLSSGTASVAYDRRTLVPAESLSSASRREISRACKETRRSSGGFHVVSEATKSPDGAHSDCACALDQRNIGAAINRIFVGRRLAELFTGRSRLTPIARSVRPIESSDVSLALDTRAEGKCDDVKNSINRLTRERCRQVQVRQV